MASVRGHGILVHYIVGNLSLALPYIARGTEARGSTHTLPGLVSDPLISPYCFTASIPSAVLSEIGTYPVISFEQGCRFARAGEHKTIRRTMRPLASQLQ